MCNQRGYLIRYEDTGYVLGKDGKPLVLVTMEEVWEEIGAYLSPDAMDADGIVVETVVGPCPVCTSTQTKTDPDFPITMARCTSCGAEWNGDEVTLDPKEVD